MNGTTNEAARPDRAGFAPPSPPCKLVGTDGNVFAIIGRVKQALKKAGQNDRASEFVQKAFAARSYDEVLAICMDYVEVR